MAAKNKFTVPQVPGSSRSSHRVYTHAVICKLDVDRYAAELPERLASLDDGTERSNFAFHSRIVQVGVGGSWDPRRNFTVSQVEFEESVAALDERGRTYGEWLAFARARHAARTASILESDRGEYQVLQWSMSERNAVKSLGSHTFPGSYRAHIHVVPVVQVP